MKKYTIKKKRDGQGWKEVNYLYANNWSHAKAVFTNNILENIAVNDGYVYMETKKECDQAFGVGVWEGKGHYPSYYASIILDDRNVDTYLDDVYTYTIKSVVF